MYNSINKLIFIDNYDSFSYILIDYIKQIYHGEVEIFRNDQISIYDLKKMKFSGIIISPGPSSPVESGICLDLVKNFYKSFPILGVCLGHQVIAEALGGKIIRAPEPRHGKVEKIFIKNNSLPFNIFHSIPDEIFVTRYHSLIIERETLPSELKVTSSTKDNIIMSISHIHYPVFGVQFHPESIKTDYGLVIIKNFIQMIN